MNSSAVKFDRFEITFIVAFFHGLKPITDKRGGKTEYLEKLPDDQFQKS